MGSLIWFMGQVIMVLLVTGVKLSPGPPADQGKIERTVAHVRNQEKEIKGLKVY
jgi:hypothetical protein